MAYEPVNWEVLVGTNLNRYTKSEETENSVVLVRNAEISQGTPQSVENMNHMEQGIVANDANATQALADAAGAQADATQALSDAAGAQADATQNASDISDLQSRPIVDKGSVVPYTLILTDANKIIARDFHAYQVVTVPPNSSVAFPIGTRIEFLGIASTGGMLFVAGEGVTITSIGDDLTPTSGAGTYTELIKYDTDAWLLHGDLS